MNFAGTTIYINPNIWSAASSDQPEDSWYAWRKEVKTNDAETLNLLKVDCRKKTIDTVLTLGKNEKGQLKLNSLSGDPQVVQPGTWGSNWVDFVCSSKNKQVKLPN